MAITLDGTNGITTPDVDTDGLTVDTNTLFVDAANNRVGIGTTVPATALSVVGTMTATGDFSSNIPADGLSKFGFASRAFMQINRVGASSGGFVSFYTATTTVGTVAERARIDESGNLLVGLTAQMADAVLNVRSNGVATTAFDRQTSDGAILLCRRNNTTVGSINVTTSSTTYSTSSDYRLKEDVQPMVGSVDRLMALKPVNFAWKVDGSRVDGFLAHEAQEVVPECVTGEKDAVDDEGNPQYQGIDQSKIVPLLVAALQEALTKIEALEARVAALETNA
jgi:hypothetical protein